MQPSCLMKRFILATAFVPCFFLALPLANAEQGDNIVFDRQILPILAENCFHCHGPDAGQRQADLRLDLRDAVLKQGAIKPSNAAESELVKRVFEHDSKTVMPPPESNKSLTNEQKDLLKRWVDQGAEYTQHWSFELPKKTEIPAGANPVDFLAERAQKSAGVAFAPPADAITLARRLSLDLVGLPPNKRDVDVLSKGATEDRIREYVDQLIASDHFGERMSIPWLDVVRFADTIGYHSDTPRNIFPYRDYVIAAFNTNKPFDQFTIEQVAGDLLPDATQEQKIASGFNRLLLTTEEGGAQAKDYEARYMGDRVRAVGAAWLGLTIGCCQCHDHKFDPLTMRDFYSMGAFFADIDEAIIGRREDGMVVSSPEQVLQRQKLKVRETQLAAELAANHPELAEAQTVWEQQQLAIADSQSSWKTLSVREAKSTAGSTLTVTAEQSVLASGNRPDKDTYQISMAPAEPTQNVVGFQLEAIPHDSLPAKASGRADNGNFVLSEVVIQVRRADGTMTPLALKSARASIEQAIIAEANPYKKWAAEATIDKDEKGPQWGWAILPDVTKKQQLQLTLSEPLSMAAEDTLVIEMRQNHGANGHLLGHFRWSMTQQALAIEAPMLTPAATESIAIMRLAKEARSAEQSARIHREFVAVAKELAPLRQRLADAQKAFSDFEAALPRTLISRSMATPRTVRILPRGNFLDESGEVVEPSLPKFLTAGKNSQRKLSRLDLAEWLVSRDNPLTARVYVNRLWKQFFGIGLAKNLDDMGAQGDLPANLELLDYLAVEFMDSGWDVKHMVRLIVNSKTYRQSSTVPTDMLSRDPDNRFLARQGRYRLPAELVRDTALSISGLLSLEIGGPSVKPYQPENYWENLNFPPRSYEADTGTKQHRRGLYTWWQRSFVHPSMLAFDAPTREECTADRTQSNIPQQSLVLLNDPTYVEAAKAFAMRIIAEGGEETAGRISWAFEAATSRKPTEAEVALLTKLHEGAAKHFQTDPAAANNLLKVGLTSVNADEAKNKELATWVQVARAILNLHEVITRN